MTSRWEVVVLSSGGAQLMGKFDLRLTSAGLEVESAGGTIGLSGDEVQVGMGFVCFWNAVSRILVVTSRRAARIFRVLLDDMKIEEVDTLIRIDDDHLRFLSHESASDESLLLLYERGLVCVNSDGSLRWHRLPDDISARIVDSNHVVWLESQWPTELAGNRIGYRLSDGQEIGSAR
ncbi:MAG: hypothetical protein LC750_08825 [Actinobacteria bacterium]|nr:hypothetical protein [Actinomycetota bacterium]